jgi:hypothetical protein
VVSCISFQIRNRYNTPDSTTTISFSAAGGVAYLTDVDIRVENTTADAKGLHTNESYTLHVDSPTVIISANTM